MTMISLVHKIGIAAVDDPLAQTVQRFEARFPGRIRGYYLLGSYADGCAVVGSDIDMYILFKEAFLMPEEAVQAQELANFCTPMSVLRLEIKTGCEQSLIDEHSIIRVALKQNSILLYGEDTRSSMTFPDRETYRRDATDGVLEFLMRLHRRDDITYPLNYPDPDGPFFGYDHKERLADEVVAVYGAPSEGGVYYATRELVECACRMATALLALKTESFVGTKRASVQVYRSVINDEWTDFLIDMFKKGKMQWKYGLPEREEERAELRRLCEEMLAFENYYLHHYRSYLLMLLQNGNERDVSFVEQRFLTTG